MTVRRGNYLTVGPLTGEVFLVRRWTERADGTRVAVEKVDITEQFDRIAEQRRLYLVGADADFLESFEKPGAETPTEGVTR